MSPFLSRSLWLWRCFGCFLVSLLLDHSGWTGLQWRQKKKKECASKRAPDRMGVRLKAVGKKGKRMKLKHKKRSQREWHEMFQKRGWIVDIGMAQKESTTSWCMWPSA